jgi:hypothetical protein
MSEPGASRPHLWPPLLLALGVVLVAFEAGHRALVLAGLATLALVPVVWRLLARRWEGGLLVRGLGIGVIACHLPLLTAVLATLERPECRIYLCPEGLPAALPLMPWTGLAGALLYWAFAPSLRPR